MAFPVEVLGTKGKAYFRLTPWYHWAWVSVGFASMIAGVFFPDAIPYDWLGPLGWLLHYMNYSQPTLLRLILVSASAVHVWEASYAYVLTRRMDLNVYCTALWTFQTLCLGFTSLLPLRAKYLQLKEQKNS